MNRPGEGATMKAGKLNGTVLRVYDPALCCSTGVCGPDVDGDLVRFAADLDWLKKRGVAVERYNAAQERHRDEARSGRCRMTWLEDAPRHLFFTGKGGVGKTSLAAATAVKLADGGRRVLLVSTDPASNLDDVLGVAL